MTPLVLAAWAWTTAATAANGCETVAPAGVTVTVVVDMDALTPGIQSDIVVAAGTSVVGGVAVYVFEPSAQACVFGIGYLGGVDRGIAFGHMPSGTTGMITGFEATLGVPINPGNTAMLWLAPWVDPGFAGAEVQYIEGGAERGAIVPDAPVEPILRLDVLLQDAAAGDVFDLYLLDFVTVWTGGTGGAFSTQGFLTLDSGGDAVPDGTQTIHGVDPDVPIPVPPAAFAVDYVDGGPGGGPATITVVPLGDLDGDGDVDTTDLLALLAAWGPCPPEACLADLDGDGHVGTADLLILLANWAPG